MKYSLALILLLLMTACGLLPEKHDETRNWSAQKLYVTAKGAMNDGSYEEAIKYFETLEGRYPYGRYARQAQLDIAYSYFKDNEPISAIAAANRFIKLYPDNPHVDYAYYLKGLVNFGKGRGLMVTLGHQDLSDRDPKATRESFQAFKILATRYPNSKYTPDATARMHYLVNELARHEVHVASYYMGRGAYVAAANRAQYVLKHYPQASAREEALWIMAKAYKALGLNKLRDDSLRVLKLNFPHSVYLAGGPKSGKSWWRFW